jgi:hypothetical protein
MPNYGLSEIRYYFDADRTAAEEVAKKTAQTVESLEIPGLRAVSVKSLVDWPKAKPRNTGTLDRRTDRPYLAQLRRLKPS